MIEKRIKTAQINLRIRPSVKAAIEQLAEMEGRSVTGCIEWHMSAIAKERGIVVEPAAKRARKPPESSG